MCLKTVFTLFIFYVFSVELYFAQWINISSKLPSSFHGGNIIDACDSNIIVVGNLFFSKDGGQSWKYISNDLFGYLSDVEIIDSLHIWAATGDGKIFATIDGGEYWVEQYFDSSKTNFMNYIEMFDLDNGISMGDATDYEMNSAVFLKTIDGGNNWVSINTSNIGGLSGDLWRRIDYLSEEIGYFYESGVLPNPQKLYKTIDGGITWFPTNFESGCSILKFFNESLGLIYANNISRTLDGGRTWEEFEIEATGWGNDIEFLPNDASQVWFTDYKDLYFSNDTGKTWLKQNIVEGDLQGRDIVFVDDKYGWLICENALYYTNNNGGIVTDIKKTENNALPAEFKLAQNYPNPFNPITTIRYEIPEQVRNDKNNVSLKVYDILGNEITTLVNGQKSAGEYQVQFNGTNLSSGIYYYQLVVGDFVKTNKMILLK